MKTISKHYVTIALSLTILIGGGWWFFATIGERENPSVRLTHDVRSIGREQTLGLVIEDIDSGLRSILVTINQDNKAHVLASYVLPRKGIRTLPLKLSIIPQTLKLHDGLATLSIAAVDYSLFKNETLINRPVTIDTTPPQIFLLTATNNINLGGCGAIAYRTSEPTIKSGVMVNNIFSSSYPAGGADKSVLVTYFGLPPTPVADGLNIRIIAVDAGGNSTSLALPYRLKNKKFRSDKMMLGDNFLNHKMPDFQTIYPELQGKSPLDVFSYVNSTLRLANEATILDICSKSDPRQLWEGAFSRMKDAAPMAQFADKRTYFYQNKSVGESVHYGVDLASLANAPVEASNHGIVKFTGSLGIYGNAILIDHGQGIFSIYGHLSQIKARLNQHVKKGEIIGNSGLTGLAGGDHLHFGMIAGGRFVNPVEWWDPHWIQDNVTKKLGNAP
ncbi:MAG: M23 family metallopeptidase [Syntrophales bacterium]